MREFFKGWRRKVGCVVLVMALAVTSVWVRSCFHLDSFVLSNTRRTSNSESSVSWVQSHDGGLEHWFSKEMSYEEISKKFQDQESDLGVIVIRGQMFEETMLWRVPYWSLTLPLTLLSAYLILWQPRKRTEPDDA